MLIFWRYSYSLLARLEGFVASRLRGLACCQEEVKTSTTLQYTSFSKSVSASQALNLNACTSQSPKKVNTSSQSNVRTLQSQEHHQQMQSTKTLQG